MTCRRLLFSHVGRMAIVALAGLFELRQFSFHRHDRFVGNRFVVVMTGSATHNRHIGSQPEQRTCAGDIYVTGRAFNPMIAPFAAALVTKHCRLSHRQIIRRERVSMFMTAAAIIAGWFLVFPMAIEARVVTVRHRLEKYVGLAGSIRQRRASGDEQAVVSLMADRAVVVIRLLLIVRL
jgi:hypothetical protein